MNPIVMSARRPSGPPLPTAAEIDPLTLELLAKGWPPPAIDRALAEIDRALYLLTAAPRGSP